MEPNPLVGAAIVRDGTAISVGHHARYGCPHAEVVAIEAARGETLGATLYATLEPCCHYGKTPPCVDAVTRSGIQRVVVAMSDPDPRVSGGGIDQLRAAGIEVELGIEQDAARRLNAPYLKLITTGRPYVTAKWAMTLDGKSATASASSQWISCARSRSLVHELRGRMDAILVGVGTVFSDDPMLTARPPGPRSPRRIVLDSAARIPRGASLVRTAREDRTVIAVTEIAPPERVLELEELGCEVVRFPGRGRVPILPLLDRLGADAVTNLLVEGGGVVAGAFHDAGQIDAVEIYIAPIIEGGDHNRTPVRGTGVPQMAKSIHLQTHQIQRIDSDVRIIGTVARPEHGL